jgi:EAL domain-containing protein (putative c-di-GMP-specific phosphodiesterase class I)
VLSLGKSLRIPVLAEGVETQAHLDFLRQEQCDEVQGFLMGRPVPHDRIGPLVSGDAPQPDGGDVALRKAF